MNREKTIRAIIISILTTIIIGSISGITLIRIMKYYEYQNRARMIGNLYSKNVEIEEELMLGLKESTAEEIQLGQELLKKYGYTINKFELKGEEAIVVLTVGTTLILGVIGSGYLVWNRKRYQRRINELTNYLELVNKGEACALAGKEDDFAILEDEIYKTVGLLYQTKELATQDKHKLKDNLADIAHQLKTPLTSMSMMNELLEAMIQSEEEQLCTSQIQKQLTRLNDLVTQLLILSKLDAQVIAMEKKEVDVYTLLLRVAEWVEPLIQEKEQQLAIQEPPDGEEIQFIGDLKWSMEAIFNLIKNCSEHTSKGRSIQVSFNQNPLFTEILIEDEGEGFSKEDIPYLFDRFYKGKNARKESVGIGLALSKALIEQQGGFIDAENRKQGGARFRIKFYSR